MLVNVSTTQILTVVTGAGQAALDNLADSPKGLPVRQCLLVPGLDVAWDNCQCGQFAQVLISSYTTNAPFDGGSTLIQSCGASYRAITVASSIVRCVSTMNDNGEPPACSAYLTDAVSDVYDREAVRTGITCFLQNLLDAGGIEYYNVGAQTPLGELGGCAGSVLTWSAAFINACPC